MCVTQTVSTMQLETKFMRLPMPVTIGSRFGDWQMTWGYWTKHRLSFLVMVVRLYDEPPAQAQIPRAPAIRSRSGAG